MTQNAFHLSGTLLFLKKAIFLWNVFSTLLLDEHFSVSIEHTKVYRVSHFNPRGIALTAFFMVLTLFIFFTAVYSSFRYIF
jgi:hypothetical protein